MMKEIIKINTHTQYLLLSLEHAPLRITPNCLSPPCFTLVSFCESFSFSPSLIRWRTRRRRVTGGLWRAELPHPAFLWNIVPPYLIPLADSACSVFPTVHPACWAWLGAAAARIGRRRKYRPQSAHFVSYLLKSVFGLWIRTKTHWQCGNDQQPISFPPRVMRDNFRISISSRSTITRLSWKMQDCAAEIRASIRWYFSADFLFQWGSFQHTESRQLE